MKGLSEEAALEAIPIKTNTPISVKSTKAMNVANKILKNPLILID
jgi:hypothetical protein